MMGRRELIFGVAALSGVSPGLWLGPYVKLDDLRRRSVAIWRDLERSVAKIKGLHPIPMHTSAVKQYAQHTL